MSAAGTPKASQAAITAVQEALDSHPLAHNTGRGWFCLCGATFEDARDHQGHVAVAAADAAAPHNAAQALRDAAQAWAEDPDDVGDSESDARNWLRDRADWIEAGQ